MENLKDFMLLFRVEPNQQQPSTEQITAMHQQWGAFIGNIAASAKLVSTCRLGFEGNLVDTNLAVSNSINIANNETLSGCMIVKAATLNAATEMAKACPVLTMGGSVEVRVLIPMES